MHFSFRVPGTLSQATVRVRLRRGVQLDDIGNRLSSTANGQVSTYTPDNANWNKQNKYASRTVHGVADLPGCRSGRHVTVDNQPTTRQDMYWHAQMDVDNAESDVYEEFQIVGVLNDQEPSGEDAVVTASRSAYVPAALQPFTYDEDGNLTGDGHEGLSFGAVADGLPGIDGKE